MCGPRGLQGEHDHLFHNNGDGTFTDVSEKAGVSDPNRYYGFTSIFADINNDGKVDLVVADDSTPNYLYINKGNGTFEDDSYASGFALNQDGRETASMGLAIGDYEKHRPSRPDDNHFLRRLQGPLSQRRRRQLHRCQLPRAGSRKTPSRSSAGASDSSITTTTAGKTS